MSAEKVFENQSVIMVACEDVSGKIKHYRVDKMQEILPGFEVE